MISKLKVGDVTCWNLIDFRKLAHFISPLLQCLACGSLFHWRVAVVALLWRLSLEG